MSTLATIALLDTKGRHTRDLRAMLTQAGYGLAADMAADVAIVADGPVAALAHKTRSGTPVIWLTDDTDTRNFAGALDSGIDEVIGADAWETEFLARLRPLVRLSTMRAELEQRAAVARRFGIEVDTTPVAPPGRPVVLTVGAKAAAAAQALANDADLVSADTVYAAESLLSERDMHAALLDCDDDGEAVMGFCTHVRHNPRLFNLPVILLGARDLEQGYRLGASRVFEPGSDPDLVRASVLALVRRQQTRLSMRAALARFLTGPAQDQETTVYTGPFLEAYLADRLAVASEHGRHLTLAVFSAPNIEGIRTQFGDSAARHLTRQVGEWINGLLRAEDMVGRTGPTEFTAILPDTPLAEAEAVVHRIAGILAYTDFAVAEVYQPVKAWVQAGITAARPEDDVAALLARARQAAC